MAIKGKSKSKTAKAVTRGPKPAYVPVKKPLLARSGLWIGIASALGVLLIVGLIAGIIAQRNSDREAALQEKVTEAVTAYGDQLAPILSAVGESSGPTGFVAFPALMEAILRLEEETPDEPADADAIATTAEDSVDSATSALEALEALEEQSLIQGQGFDEAFVLNLVDSKGNFIRSMTLFVEAAELTRMAAEAEGAERAALLVRARGVADAASELAVRGNSQFIEAQVKGEVFAPPAPPAGLPLPTGS